MATHVTKPGNSALSRCGEKTGLFFLWESLLIPDHRLTFDCPNCLKDAAEDLAKLAARKPQGRVET
jgi:hypothetical protein